MIKVEKAGKGYNKVMAVENIAMTVDRGEIHGIVGSNGAGKTTLLKCLAGIYRTDEGRITYDGKDIYDNPEVKQKVAYISDSQEFISIYSVSGMIKLYQNFYSSFSIEKFNELNEKFQLNKKKNVGSLSKGQKMKLAFMLAIAQGSEYLLMDEPESGLDVESRQLFWDILIDEVEKRQLGVVISSHNLTGIEKVCDSISIMEKGHVTWQGDLDRLMESAQKWQAIWNGSSLEDKFSGLEIQVCGQIGKLTEFYTLGNREKNRELLQKRGAEELEGRHITLEEIYCLMKRRNSVSSKGGDGV